jgi:hypothetical protein
MPDKPQEVVKEKPQVIDFAEFLESVPPSINVQISNLVERRFDGCHRLCSPELQLHCASDACNGTRFFRRTDNEEHILPADTVRFVFVTYTCSNCRETSKLFSLAVRRISEGFWGQCLKLGELPAYGPPTPPRLIHLIGPDRELFLKGRRCENKGLGIGAFVYYRRVIENQKNRILDEIIKVAGKLNAGGSTIAALEAAKEEQQFAKALDSVKNTMPQSLLINGHNPMTLLRSALSEGLHNQSDEECLGIASSVRVVLGELSERLGQALKDEVELNTALSKLLNRKSGMGQVKEE